MAVRNLLAFDLGAESGRALLGRLIQVLGANCGHHGQPTHGIQSRADHASVDAVVGVVAHQVGLHVDAAHHAVRRQGGDLEPQDLVEHNLFFKDGLEPGNELGLESLGLGGNGFAHGVLWAARRGAAPAGDR